MLRPVVRIHRMGRPGGFVFPKDARLPDGSPHPRAGMKATVTMLLKCGHLASGREDPFPKRPVKVHCSMCTFLYKEREVRSERRLGREMRREKRRIRQQLKVEQIMAKKASAKVVKKKDLKLVGKNQKTVKGKRRSGRKWYKPENLAAPKGSLLAKVLDAFASAAGRVIGENDLIAAMEKAGVKAEGKKTVKKLVKAVLRNMSRAGVIVKDRDRDKDEEKVVVKKKGKDEDDDEDENEEVVEEEETDDDDESESDGDSEPDDEEDDDDEEESEEKAPPTPKKNLKKPVKAKPKAKAKVKK